MSAAAFALRTAIHAVLSGDAALAAMLPSGNLLDRTPQGVSAPYLIYGSTRSEDYSTATEAGEEHVLVLEVWADGSGQKAALSIAARIVTLIDDAGLTPAGTRLVGISHLSTRTRRDARMRAVVAELQFRAVTED